MCYIMFAFVVLKAHGREKHNEIARKLRMFAVNNGMNISVEGSINVTREFAERHYAEHAGKPFFADACATLVGVCKFYRLSYIRQCGTCDAGASDPTMPVRAWMKQTRAEYEPFDAPAKNFIHASDSAAAAAREWALWNEYVMSGRAAGLSANCPADDPRGSERESERDTE